jgi:hypothetical protein
MDNSISGSEAADRLAIRELIEAYALCAGGRDAKRQMAHVGLPPCDLRSEF